MHLKILRFFVALCITNIIINSSTLLNDKKEYDLSENLIYQAREKIGNYVSFEEIPETFIKALISAEDKRFYKHIGFDPISIANAIYVDVREQRFVLGGSTLTQQLCKNMFLNPQKNIKRKFKELILALNIENQYTKNEIIELYSNVIYYGEGAYGIKEAAKIYFKKELNDLTTNECALLAGLPKGPSSYNPKKNYKKAFDRRNKVLDLMLKNGYLKVEKYRELKLKPIFEKTISDNEIVFFCLFTNVCSNDIIDIGTNVLFFVYILILFSMLI